MKILKSIFFILATGLLSQWHILDATWSPPIQISDGPSSVNSTGTPLVINNNSVALIGWLDGTIGVSQTNYSANLFPFSNNWTHPLLIYANFTPGIFPSFPTMSQDIYGGSTAAYGLIDGMTGSVIINASRRPKGLNFWLPPISTNLVGSPFAASLAIDDIGNVAVLFALTTTGTPPYAITLSELPATSQAWTSMVLAIDNSTQPAVAAKTHNEHGNLAWKVNTPTLEIQTLRFNFATHESSSMINVPLPPLTTDIIALDIAVDDIGDAILIFTAQIGGNNVLYSSTLLADEEAWTSPILISNPTHTVISGSIATDALGKSTILWGEQITPTQQFVRVVTLSLGGSPIDYTDLTDRSALNTTVNASSRVVMDSFGNAAAIWSINMGGFPTVQVSSKAIKQNWLTPITLSTQGDFPLITLSDQGTAVATWIDSVTNILMGSRNLYLFSLRPPSQFIGELTETITSDGSTFVLRMSWKPSPAPNIVDYEIYLNGALIGTVPGIGPFVLNVPQPLGKVIGVYTLIAVASNGNRSVPVTLNIKPEVAPPSNFDGLLVKNKFATQTAFSLAMSWSPSPAQNVIAYEIFKNGKRITTVSANEPLEFVKQLHSKNIKGDYYLVAVTVNGQRSIAIPLTKK